jgi:hypothetical protein
MSDDSPISENEQVYRPTALGNEGAQRFLTQVFELWINPEMEGRIAARQAVAPVVLASAQVIFPPDGAPLVRLNDEVRGYAWTRIDRAVEQGDAIYEHDLHGLQGFDLHESELDFGHVTLISAGDKWFSAFNFLTQRGRALSLLKKANEFLEASVVARTKGHSAVVVDTLFSACELTSKAELLVSRQVKDDAVSHRALHSRINAWGKLGNIEGAFVELFNRLAQLRYLYRYETAFSDAMPVTEDDLDLVATMITARQQGFGPRDRRKPRPA